MIRTQDTGFKVQGDNHFTIREKAFYLLTARTILCTINIQDKYKETQDKYTKVIGSLEQRYFGLNFQKKVTVCVYLLTPSFIEGIPTSIVVSLARERYDNGMTASQIASLVPLLLSHPQHPSTRPHSSRFPPP